MIRMSTLERTRLEGLLGEPLMVSDPLIDIKQASAVLGLTAAAVRRMLRAGALPCQEAADGRLTARTLRLADVLAWAKSPARITVAEAAGLLGESSSAVHRLIAVRLLGWCGGQWPVVRSEVESLVTRRRDWLTLAQAANALRTSPEEVHQLLGSGALTHTHDVSRPVDKAQVPQLA
jgi:predicted DNA-binding transcriptional regulator AlpA